MTNYASVVENFFRISRAVVKDMEDRYNAVQSGNWHRDEEQYQEKREQSIDKRWLVWIDRISTTVRRSPFVEEQHVPRCAHNPPVSENGWRHENQHCDRKPHRCDSPVVLINTVNEGNNCCRHENAQCHNTTDSCSNPCCSNSCVPFSSELRIHCFPWRNQNWNQDKQTNNPQIWLEIYVRLEKKFGNKQQYSEHSHHVQSDTKRYTPLLQNIASVVYCSCQSMNFVQVVIDFKRNLKG